MNKIYLISGSALRLKIFSFLLLLLGIACSQGASAQTITSTTTGGLWNATTTWVGGVVPGSSDQVIINGPVTLNAAAEIQSLTINATRTFTMGGFALTVHGSTSISGTLAANSAVGLKTFRGGVTVHNGGIWNTSSGSPSFRFEGNIINNGTMNGVGTGAVQFAENNLQISGSNNITFGGSVTVVGAITVRNQNTGIVTINGALDGTSAQSVWLNDTDSRLNYANTLTPMVNGGMLNCAAQNNTFSYTGGNQTVAAGTYWHIAFSGSGTKTISTLNILGNFTRTAASINVNDEVQFSGSSDAVYNVNININFKEVSINKAGAKLNLQTSGFTCTALQIQAGTLEMGANAKTLSVQGNLSGAGKLDISGANHTVNLSGEQNSIGEIIATNSNANINYNRNGNQQVIGSLHYRNLTFSGSGVKQLMGGARVGNLLNFTSNVIFRLGIHDIKLSAGATLSGSFSAARMIETNGLGSFIKEGTTIEDFTTNIPSGIYPVGSGGFYSPFRIDALAATVVGTASISVRAVPDRQPNVPYFNNALIKYWQLEAVNLGNINANLSFSFNASEVIGTVGFYVPRIWNGTSLVEAPSPSAPGSNPFTSNETTFITGDWTYIDPTVRTTIYSYQSGDWNNPSTWTTDPSGSTSVLPMVPGVGDAVVILNGRNITTTVARTIGSLIIQGGGTLDIGATNGNNFGAVSGEGLLRLSSANFPGGVFTNFVSANGGTVEYYNLPSGSHTISPAQTVYNNLIFSNTSAVSYNAVFNANHTINGNLHIQRTGTGSSNVYIGFSANSRTINVMRNLHVGSGCLFGIGAFNAIHTLNLHGNLTVNGQMILTNGAAQATPANGACNVHFQGAFQNTTATFASGSSTRFYGCTSSKNDGIEVALMAANGATVEFFNNGPAVRPLTGTMRLGNNIHIAALGGISGNYDLGSPTSLPTLWIDGATVQSSQSNSIVPYGTLKITAGTLNCNTGASSIVIRESGMIELIGGTINARMIRTSVTASTHRGAYVQSGGTLNLLETTGGPVNHYAIFSLPYSENVFKMYGGTINLTRNINCSGGLLIGSSPNNYDVTGGQVNIIVSNTHHFEINTSAPLPNLNIVKNLSGGSFQAILAPITWSFSGSPAHNVTEPARPLHILGNLTLQSGNGTLLNANNQDIVIGGHFEIQSNTTYTAGNQTLIFNGTGNQNLLVSGTISAPGLGSLEINKPSGVLSLAGSASTITANQNVRILSGSLNDGGKTLQVRGLLHNQSLHTGTGRIVMNGTTPQEITGNGSGIFQNLELASTAGAAGSIAITMVNPMQVNGILLMSTDRLLAINSQRLTLGPNGAIQAASGSFSHNRYIQTSGFLSDGGIRKTFSNVSVALFPFGTAANNYTPATMQFNQAPASWGTVDVRPVRARQLYVTDLNCFEYYWKVNQSGFSGIPSGSIQLTFNYGLLPDNAAYIPGYYNFETIAYTTINDVNAVNESTKNIHFNNWSQLAGDYTAGVPAAFGTVIPYYSRANGQWDNPSTWSNAHFNGPSSTTIPTANSPVFIGNGSNINHTVTVIQNNSLSGSLVINNGSTLDLVNTTGHNFGALPYATAGGQGKLRISSNSGIAEFPAGDFGLFFQNDGGITEYYGTGTNFSLPQQTASPTLMPITTYNELVIKPSNNQQISLPDNDLLVFKNFEISGSSGGTVFTTDGSSRLFRVNQNFNIGSGKFQFKNNNNQQLHVGGNLVISSGSEMSIVNGGNKLHSITLLGNLTNHGLLNLDNNSDAILHFTSTSDQFIQGTQHAAITKFHKIVVNKGNSQSPRLTLNVAGTLTTPSNDWLELINGNFIFQKGSTITLSDQPNINFVIPATAAFTMNHPQAVVNVAMNNQFDSDLWVLGRLELLNGIMNVGDPTANRHNDIEYGSTHQPTIIVGGNAQLNVNGQIRRSVFATVGSLRYTQSGNSVVVVRGKNPDNSASLNLDRAKFEILNDGSQFNMSGNSLLVIDRNGIASNYFGDIFLHPASFQVTGGEIRIGTGLTANNSQFRYQGTTPLWNLSVDGNSSNKILVINGHPLQVLNDLRIEGNSVLNTNGLAVSIGRNLVNENTNNTPGLNQGGFRAMQPDQVTTFTGPNALQQITGTHGNLTQFANLVIDNNTANATIALQNNTHLRINGQLSILNGTFHLADNLATVAGHVLNQSVQTNTSSGALVLQGNAIQNLSGNGNGVFGSVRINNAAGIHMIAPTRFNGILHFVNGIIYINNHLLTLGEQASIGGTVNVNNMIRTNGVLSDAGVRKLYPAAPANFTFPIGISLKYTPATLHATANTEAGSITVKPVNSSHPATTDPLDKELTYYWNVTSTGFNEASTFNHEYRFLNSDAANGDKFQYVTGRYLNNVWFPVNGIPSSVNPSQNFIFLNNVNYINGDYTAGESTEFAIIHIYYSRNATLGGMWNDVNSWSTDQTLMHAGPPASVPPSFNPIVIAEGHTIVATSGNLSAPSVVNHGLFNIGNTVGHNFGAFSGNGTLRITPTSANVFVFPGGNFSDFTSSNGGTVEYFTNGNATLPTQAVYNHLNFSGNGTKSLPNNNILVNGNFRIEQGSVNNPNNRQINLNQNWINLSGLNAWNGGAGVVVLSGGQQQLNGSTNFSNLTVNGGSIKSLLSTQYINGTLTLNQGIVETQANELVVRLNGNVNQLNNSSYINGRLRKEINSNTSEVRFEIGDANYFTPVNLFFTGSTNASGSILAFTNPGEHIQILSSGIDPNRSLNRTYTLINNGVTGFTHYAPVFQFAVADVDAAANPLQFSASRFLGGVWQMAAVANRTGTSTSLSPLTQFGVFQLGEAVDGIIWTGLVNTNWNLADNWLPSQVPSAADNVFIGMVNNQPSLFTGNNGICRNISLETSALVDITNNYTLNIHGKIISQGNRFTGQGLITFASNACEIEGNFGTEGSVHIPEGAQLSLSPASVLEVGRNLLVQGNLVHNQSNIRFFGNQHSEVNASTALHQITIQKASSDLEVKLIAPLEVNNAITFNTGDLNLENFDLHLGATGYLNNESAANCMKGGQGRAIATRQLNAPNQVDAAGLGAIISSSANLGETEIIRGHQQKTVNGSYGINRYFEIHPTHNSNLNATLEFRYFEDELVTPMGSFNEADLDLYRYNGSIWEKQNAWLDMVQNRIVKNNLFHFSTWTAGAGINSSLPITLVSFDAECKGEQILTKWTTAAETNNQYFLVESSKDGIQWKTLEIVAGAGNSNQIRNYSITSDKPYAGGFYLRMTQVDFNGDSESFDPLFISCESTRNEVKIYPNPVVNNCQADVLLASAAKLRFCLFNSAGQIIWQREQPCDNGLTTFRFDMSSMPPGSYHLSIFSEQKLEFEGNRTIIKK